MSREQQRIALHAEDCDRARPHPPMGTLCTCESGTSTASFLRDLARPARLAGSETDGA